MKKDLIKVFKTLENGKEVELLADEKQIPVLASLPEFRIPESKKAPSKKENGKEVEKTLEDSKESPTGQSQPDEPENAQGAEGQ
ncbi:hypothetical protein [Leptospira stimsonii]|uniref:Acetyl-CoA carboxylase biotin carboxyl carrier protein subunit n=1 Tax=Leptospira stimsonii TaxID=2202203 RepID=A0ABY2N8W1_9LEPT|nr:hypothetical protein [Leptospira stimsonii]TGK12853.1 hypothetical protein EHO98_19645 [Leptospira stimsonii]TGM18793.1 hypothetical protein EHQ90_06395 [Leptospira stimsonii]